MWGDELPSHSALWACKAVYKPEGISSLTYVAPDYSTLDPTDMLLTTTLEYAGLELTQDSTGYSYGPQASPDKSTTHQTALQ